MQMVNPVVHNCGTSEMSQSDSEAVERLGGDGEVNLVVSEKPSQSDSEAVERLDGDGEVNLVESEKLPVPVSSSDDDDSLLEPFKGCEWSMSDETVNALPSSCDADSVLSGPVTAVFQDTGQPTRTDTSYMVSCSPSTSVHSSDTVQSPVSPGFVTGTSLQQLTNAPIYLAVSGCNGLFVHYTQKQVQLKVSVFLLYPLGSVCLKYSMKPHLLTC